MCDCIFCKIVKGDIPSPRLYEDENFIVIRDINPLCKVHDLIITKKHIKSVNEIEKDDEKIFASLFSVVKKIAAMENMAESGYRVVVNSGKDSGQAVPHFHAHVLGGEDLKGKLQGM